MTRAIPQPTRIERAARVAATYNPVETEGITRLPWWASFLFIGVLSVGAWVIVYLPLKLMGFL